MPADSTTAGIRPPKTPAAMTPPEVARRWKVSPDKVLAFIRAGELQAFNISSKPSGRPRYRILMDEVIAFEQRRTVRQRPRPRQQRRRRTQYDFF